VAWALAGLRWHEEQLTGVTVMDAPFVPLENMGDRPLATIVILGVIVEVERVV
jgi:hypothetical protein